MPVLVVGHKLVLRLDTSFVTFVGSRNAKESVRGLWLMSRVSIRNLNFAGIIEGNLFENEFCELLMGRGDIFFILRGSIILNPLGI